MGRPIVATGPDAARVLTQAVVRTAERLALTQKTVARTLGVSEASVSRMNHSRMLDTDSKEGELAVLLVRLYRSLDAMVGGSDDQARLWMHAPNHHLGAIPAELIRTIGGLVRVVEYLDALRGKS